MKPAMKIHVLLHAPFEGMGCIADWISENKFHHTETKFWELPRFPAIENVDLLIIMGGPMSVNDEKKYSWLHPEKNFIERAINHGKQVLGICLGAQLIANVLGSTVYPNKHKEIGWYPVRMNENAANTCFHFFPKQFVTFHWHGDTFDLPQGAVHLAQSEATLNQAFIFGDNVAALQFHPEMTQTSMKEMLKDGSDELKPAKFVQSADAILKNLNYADENNALLKRLLDEQAKNFFRQQLLHVL
ncbi:MAG TPA: type 1 glutamine amidotransferase [Chitinophagales bacterium]|nr:type 1 glutamine amidotransferase [Chitinophagales bacterium]